MSEANFSQLMTRLVNNVVNNTTDNTTLITVLSLTCLLSILNRGQAETIIQESMPSPVGSSIPPLQRALNELSKGGDESGGPSPDLLMSLLPLLNSPQIKSKINPANIATLFNLLSSMGGGGGEKSDKAKASSNKAQNISEPVEIKEAPAITPPAESVQAEPEDSEMERREGEKKTSNHLNWKSNF